MAPFKGTLLGCGLLLLIGIGFVVAFWPTGDNGSANTPVARAAFPALTALSALPPHEVTDVHHSGTKSIWYFIVVPKTTSKADLRKIAEFYAAKHPEMLVLNVDIHCDRKYASYATGIASEISDREYFSHVIFEWMAGKNARADNSIERRGLGTACGK